MQYVFALYCISKGLCVANTSVAARRSHQIGGYHLAKLFCIMVIEVQLLSTKVTRC